jgi:hypothetical protein
MTTQPISPAKTKEGLGPCPHHARGLGFGRGYYWTEPGFSIVDAMRALLATFARSASISWPSAKSAPLTAARDRA